MNEVLAGICKEFPEFWPTMAVGLGLFSFGLLYSQLVNLLSRRLWSRDRSSLLVIIGVTVTLIGAVPLLGWRAVLVLFFLFGCSGLPMTINQLVQTWRNESEFRRQVLNGDENVEKEDRVADPWAR